MQHTGGRVFASTAAFAGAAGIAYDLSWAILWIAITIALFDTVFQLIRAIGEGPARGARRPPLPRPADDTVITLP
jgi:hypothetical protein